METVEHKFGPGETVLGVIKKYNRRTMSNRLTRKLRDEVIKLNPNVAPRIGTMFLIPVHDFINEPEVVPNVKKVIINKTPPADPVEQSPPEVILKADKVEFTTNNDDELSLAIRQERRRRARLKSSGVDISGLPPIDELFVKTEDEPEEEKKPEPKIRKIQRPKSSTKARTETKVKPKSAPKKASTKKKKPVEKPTKVKDTTPAGKKKDEDAEKKANEDRLARRRQNLRRRRQRS